MSVSFSVRDSDGEFLLIEAADSLPSWVTPSVVENRVRNLFELSTSQAPNICPCRSGSTSHTSISSLSHMSPRPLAEDGASIFSQMTMKT
jgi:SGT1 protein